MILCSHIIFSACLGMIISDGGAERQMDKIQGQNKMAGRDPNYCQRRIPSCFVCVFTGEGGRFCEWGGTGGTDSRHRVHGDSLRHVRRRGQRPHDQPADHMWVLMVQRSSRVSDAVSVDPGIATPCEIELFSSPVWLRRCYFISRLLSQNKLWTLTA